VGVQTFSTPVSNRVGSSKKNALADQQLWLRQRWLAKVHVGAEASDLGAGLRCIPPIYGLFVGTSKKTVIKLGWFDFCVFFINQEKHAKNAKKTRAYPNWGFGSCEIISIFRFKLI
jgi:hypothetical protein